MPQTDAPALVDVLAEMFTVSGQQGAQVHRRLFSGLHVKVGVRGERRMIIVWRDGDRLPSAKECEIVGEDAGFYDPKYRAWRCKESDSAFLIQEGYAGSICEHEWGFVYHMNARPQFAQGQVCRRCGVRVAVHSSRRANGKTRYAYDKWELREHVWERWLKRGPVPGSLVTLPHHDDPGDTSPPPVAAEPLTPQQEAAQAERGQEAQDAAEKAHLIGLLTCVMLHHAAVNPWFRQGHVIAARRKFLKDSALEDLREECRGRLFAWAFPAARPYVFLVVHWASYGARWRHAHRALPVKATASRKARKPRTPRKAVAAA